MGAIHLQSTAFPRALQREAESLFREKDSELQAAGLRSLAARLERRRPELAIQIYGLLADSPTTPEEHRQVSRDRFAALQGQGSGGARFEALMGRFLPEATDYRTIVPMMMASSVAGVVRAAALGRFAAGGASWFSRGLGARTAAGGLAFAAEVPAFTLSGRALHALGGQPSESPLGRDLAAAALSLGCLKGFVGIGAKLSPRPALSAAVFAPAGLYTAHGIEERIGWRAPSDSASRAFDAIAASLSLGIGARLGRDLAGEGFQRRLSEASMRAELAQARPRLELRMPWLPEPMLMTAGSGDGKLPGSTEGARNLETAAPVRSGSFSFKKYREIFGLTLMGDPVHNIESRLAGSADPVRVLELNPGGGTAVQELKQRFGDRVVVETVKDWEESGDFLKADFGERRYHLILSLFGPPLAEGQLAPVFQKAVDHLLPGGEFAAARSAPELRHSEVSTWKKMEGLPAIGAAVQQGLLLRSERAAGNFLLYAQRLGTSGPSLEKILQSSGEAKPVAGALASLERQLEKQTMSGAGRQWRLERSAAVRIAACLSELGAQETLVLWPNLAQRLLDRFQASFAESHHRPPAAHEIQHWIDGYEPSALWSKELFVDEWLRLQGERARELARTPTPIPGSILAVGVGLSAFFGSSRAWAGTLTEQLSGGWEFSPVTASVAGLGLVAATWLGHRVLGRFFRPKENFHLQDQEKAYFNRILDQFFSGRFSSPGNINRKPDWILQIMLVHYNAQLTRGKDPNHPVGDQLLLRAAASNPNFKSRLPLSQQAILERVIWQHSIRNDETGVMAWTTDAAPELSSEEITLPGGPKVLDRRSAKKAAMLGAGALSLLHPRLAEAASEFRELPWRFDWKVGLGATGVALVCGYGLLRLIRAFDSPIPKRTDFFADRLLPSAWNLAAPANDNVLLLIEGIEAGRTPSKPKPGWIKEERKRIFDILKKNRFQGWERELAMHGMQNRLIRGLTQEGDLGEAAKLMWDLSVAPQAGAEGRRWFKASYSVFINSPLFFEFGGPMVYRECIRLRSLFSDPRRPLEQRVAAVEAYAQLFRKFDLDKPVARAESRMGRNALADFLGEGGLKRGTRPFMIVNGARLDIDSGRFLWRSGQRNGLKAGNEDWEGNY